MSDILWRIYKIFNKNETSLRISIFPIKFSNKNQAIPNAANCLIQRSNKHQHACELNMIPGWTLLTPVLGRFAGELQNERTYDN